MTAYVIRSAFWPMCAYFAKLLGSIIVPIFLLGSAWTWFEGHPDRAVNLALVALGAIPVIFAIGLLLAATTIPWQCRLTATGIEGRSYMGFRRRIRYEDISAHPFIDNSQYVPLLYVTDRTSGKSLVILLGVLDVRGIHEALLRLAGPANPLTQSFDPGA